MMSLIRPFCKYFKACWPIALFVLLLTLAWFVYSVEIDRSLHLWIMKHQSTSETQGLQKFYGILSHMGQLEFKIIIGLMIMAYLTWVNHQPQLRMFWWRAMLVMTAIGVLVIPLKHIFGRPRPKMEWRGQYEMEWFETASNMHSFPSGHATTTWAFFFFLTRYWPKYTPVWLLYAVSASYARMGIGSHYLGDVIAGSTIGFFVAYWAWPKVAPKELQRRTSK
jgi:membrane-associated phospholipid phosphatase